MASQSELVGSAEACRILNVHAATIGRWVAAEPPVITPALKLPGKNGAYLFNRADIEALRDERAEAAS